MNLDSAISVAAGGIGVIDRQLALVSHDVANASTPGYAREVSSLSSVTADGQGMGVRDGPATREIDTQIQADLLTQNATVSGWQTTTAALSAVDAAMGTPGQGNDLPSLLGGLHDAFAALAGDPANPTQQAQTVSAAAALAGGINALAQAVGTQRQAAQDGLGRDVAALNADLSSIGKLTDRIRTLGASGESTADLENQRDGAMADAAGRLDIRFLRQSDGGMLAVAGDGLTLSLGGDPAAGPLAVAAATVGPGAAWPVSLPGVTLRGADVTTRLSGGSIGANIALRDSTLPVFQAELDEFSQTLATRFDAQGLRLFTDPAGNVPTPTGPHPQSGYLGFAGTIGVNPAVQANPALLRDGTQAVAGSPGGASAFAGNTGGAAGFTGMITRVLDYALGAQAQAGVAQALPNASSLGPLGTLSAPAGQPATLSGFAAALTGAQAQASADAQSQLSNETAVQTTLQGKLSASAAVSVDAEMATMIQLQNAYGANAKIITAAQSMWTALLNAVTP